MSVRRQASKKAPLARRNEQLTDEGKRKCFDGPSLSCEGPFRVDSDGNYFVTVTLKVFEKNRCGKYQNQKNNCILLNWLRKIVVFLSMTVI